MEKAALLNELKFMELKLHTLKAQVEAEKPKIKTHTSESLYGLLKESEDITNEDIEAIKVKLKESV